MDVVQVRVRAKMLASARARVSLPLLLRRMHGRRTGVSVCVAAIAASSRGHDASAVSSHAWASFSDVCARVHGWDAF